MVLHGECPICYRTHGEQDDGYFLVFNGKDNYNDFREICKHYICTECCAILAQQETVSCPLCREDWTDWIHACYLTDSEEEDPEDSEGEEDSEDSEGEEDS